MAEERSQIYDESQIEVLEGLEAVRRRPGMYIGSTGSKGLHHLVYEIVDNSIDEALGGFCNNIAVTINEDGSVTVEDNGRGMPTGVHPKTKLSTVETILTILHAGGKFGGNGYKKSGGLHGVGSSVVNALSEFMIATVFRNGQVHQMRLERGKTIDKLKVIGNTDKTGTTIRFKPDKDIFESVNFNYSTLANRFRELAYLNKNITIQFEDKRSNKQQANTYHFEGGLKQFIEYINKDKIKLHDLIPYQCKESPNLDVEFSLQYTDDYTENLHSFVNNINTSDGGTHLNGFKAGLLNAFNDYTLSNNLISSKFQYEDIKEGINGIISIKLEEPEFEGQTKGKLGTSFVKKEVEDIVFEYFHIFFKENPEIRDVLIKRAISTKQFREDTKKNKELLKTKERLKKELPPSKLADCSSKNPEECEIYIVEGDSGGGTAKQGRNRKNQAVLPIRGKILNVEKQRFDRVLAAETIQDIVKAFGTGFGEEFDITKLKYHTIGLLVDGDSDGRHIATLILTLIYRYMKPLLEKGYVYLCNPPLYKNTVNNRSYYTYTEPEQKIFLEKNPNKKFSIQRFKGIGEMSQDQLWETTLNPEARILQRVTVDDAMECDKTISLLMGDQVEPRKEFLKRKAIEVIDNE